MKQFTKVNGNESKFVKNIKCLHVKDELPKVKCKFVAPNNSGIENAKLNEIVTNFNLMKCDSEVVLIPN